MIESRYWKEDLLRHARKLSSAKRTKRWSERLAVNFEKELIISFFCIRKLFENNKVSLKLRQYKADIFSCSTAEEQITRLNQWFIDEVYNLENERKVERNICFIANQLIHSCTAYAYRDEDGNWAGIYVCSDWERNKAIYRIPINAIIKIFNTVGHDYPHSIKLTRERKGEDYEVELC